MFLTIHRENYSKERGGIFIFSFARTKKEKRKTYSDTFKLRAQFRLIFFISNNAIDLSDKLPIILHFIMVEKFYCLYIKFSF